MGINQKLLNRALLMTLCVCIMLMAGNMSRLFYASQELICIGESQQKLAELSLWENSSFGVYTMDEFCLNGYLSLRDYLNKVVDKRIISFEVLNGRAKVVFEQV